LTYGKYAVRSNNNNQYYLLFVDDAKHYATVDFVKEKSDASQGVINYLTHLITQGRTPKAIQIDCGREFVNEELDTWCKEHGIEIHFTAPYSPSQNGVAERMNRTLVELSRAMLIANNLPEFLWEYAVLHAAYLRNRSYTQHLANSTPYQGWHNIKPNVSYLREFGAPIWILLQGQKEQRKMLPKSKHQAYVGFNDSARAVKYYNAETRKVLTSRNFGNITPPDNPTPPEPIELTPNMPHEGETGGSMPPMGVTGSDDRTHNLEPKRKRKRNEIEEDDVNINAPQKTRGIRTDYQHLHDPFPEEEEEETFLSMEEAFAIIAGDKLTSLKEAKDSPEWPEWEEPCKSNWIC
jgi:Integrase core domain